MIRQSKIKPKKKKMELVLGSAKKFKRQFKKELNTAVIAAFGLLTALIWRDVITEFVEKISSTAQVKGKLISALITTLICVIGILITTKFIPNEESK